MCAPESHAKKTRIQDFRILRLIGTGGSSTVVCAKRLATGARVAVKAVSKKELCSKKRVWYLRREIAIHKSLKNVNGVVGLEEVFEDGDGVYMVMELLSGGDVYCNLERDLKGCDHGVEEWIGLEILRQVLKVLVECHERGISHRDVKLENIVFREKPNLRNGENLKVKLVDWGLACFRDENGVSGEKVGTLRYCAPEIVDGEKYKPAECDMWSCGAVLYSLLMKCSPYDGKCEAEIVRNMMKEKELNWRGRKISGDTKNLIRRLLSRHGRNRPKAKEALEMIVDIMENLRKEKAQGDGRIARSCAEESRTASQEANENKSHEKPCFDLGIAINRFLGGIFGGNNEDKGSELCK